MVVCPVCLTNSPNDAKLSLCFAVFQVSLDLAAFGIIDFLISPTAVELSVVTSVLPWLCPISIRVTCRGATALQL